MDAKVTKVPKKTNKKTNKKSNKEVCAFSKEQILHSKKYANRKDLLGVILEDGETYEMAEVDELLNNYMKGEVE